MEDTERVRRAEQSRIVLESPVFIEAWDSAHAYLHALIDSVDSADVDKLAQIKRLLVSLKQARGYLERLISDGSVAAATIRLDDERKKRKWG
jgi:hypothetical protein